MTRNVAGLSTRPDDDGVFLNYSFLKPEAGSESNFTLSMQNLAFSVQNFSLDDDALMRTYSLGIAVGGKVLSIGSSNKIVQFRSSEQTQGVFIVDAGLIFQPVSFLSIAASARNLNEPLFADYQFQKEYSASISLKLLDQRIKILTEAAWYDDIIQLERARFKSGISLVLLPEVELLVGGVLKQEITSIFSQKEEFFAMLQIPFFGGIRFLSTVRIDDQKQLLRYSISLLIPLKTLTF